MYKKCTMNSNYAQLQISASEARAIADDIFNVSGVTTRLNGEIDFNYSIVCANSKKYILKISRPNVDRSYLDFQQKLLQHLSKSPEVVTPKIVLDKHGSAIGSIIDAHGNLRYVRLLTWVYGRLWSTVNPHTNSLRYSLGFKSGMITKALQGFKHPMANRKLDWDNSQVEWVFLFSSFIAWKCTIKSFCFP